MHLVVSQYPLFYIHSCQKNVILRINCFIERETTEKLSQCISRIDTFIFFILPIGSTGKYYYYCYYRCSSYVSSYLSHSLIDFVQPCLPQESDTKKKKKSLSENFPAYFHQQEYVYNQSITIGYTQVV